MGVPATLVIRLMLLHRANLLRKGQRMLELGQQNLNCAGQAHVIQQFASVISGADPDADFDALADRGLSGDLFELAGLDVTCLDIFEGKRVHVADLNHDAPPVNWRSAFDIVTNFGTTEHILNQYACFDFIHNCTKPGGLMIHQLPMQGWSDHCFVKYNPKFFFLLAIANDYTLIDFRINAGAKCTNNVSYWTSMQKDILGPKTDTGDPDQNKGCLFVLRRENDQPFVPPIDKTSGPLTKAELSQLQAL